MLGEETKAFSKFLPSNYDNSSNEFRSNSKAHEITIINSLNEPVSETIVQISTKFKARDLKNIKSKLESVLFPYKNFLSEAELRKCLKFPLTIGDLWGPMIFCIFMAMTISFAHRKEADVIFATIFVLVWIGASIITINMKLLGSRISFFQSISLVGYCVFPIAMASLVLGIIGNYLPILFRAGLVLGSMTWSIASSLAYLTNSIPKGKLILAVYPLCLFFAFLSWFVYLM